MTGQPLPELVPLLEAFRSAPPMDFDGDVPEMRAAVDAGVQSTCALVRPAGPLQDVVETAVADTRVRVYRAVDQPHPDAVHVHLHGGGWWMGNLDTADAIARELASASGLTVVSVGYRLAPEAPWPAALEDVHAVLAWAADTLDPVSLSVGGESAGANLAAAACLVARERGGPALVAQWLDVPAVDLTFPDGPSLQVYGTRYGLDIEALRPLLDWYVDDEHRTHPWVSPLLAPDHTGLPPAIITTNELDPIADQGTAYAAALREAGVPVEHTETAGQLHGTTWLTGLTASGAAWHDRSVAALVRLHLASRPR